MKSRAIIIGLIVLMAAMAGWATRLSSVLATADGDIAVLNKKVLTAEKEAAAAQAESRQLAEAPVKSPTPVVLKDPSGINSTTPPTTATAAEAQALLAAARAEPPGQGRDRDIREALMADAKIEPQAAWDVAQSLASEDPGSRLMFLRGVLSVWAATDPAKAAELLPSLQAEEDSAFPGNTTGLIEANWLKVDPVAAAQWIDTLTKGNTRDSAIIALAAGADDADLPTAFKWVSTMADANKRGGTINNVVTQWAKTDPVAARDAVMALYTNNNNGRQAALLAIIAREAPDVPVNPAPAPTAVPVALP